MLLYATEFSRPLPDEDFQRLLRQLPAAMQAKIVRFRRWEDAHAALLGKHLLLLALKDAGSEAALTDLAYSPEAKPYLPNGPEFNISHSGNRVVCALSRNGRIGIDIEYIKPLSFDDFQTQFTEREWLNIRNSPDPVASFYRFWTAKESLIKADGRGLGIPLLDLDVTEYQPVSIDGATWNFQPLFHFQGYAAHLCTESPTPEIRLRELLPAFFSAALE